MLATTIARSEYPDLADNPHRLLRYREASYLLGTTEQALRSKVCQGKGPRIVKVGRSARIRLADVYAYVDAQQTVGGAA